VPVLEVSTTGHATSPTTGVEIKSGDSTRTLVGMVYTTAASVFADSLSQRFVASWFNRRLREFNSASQDITITAVSMQEMTIYRCSFITWNDEAVNNQYAGLVDGTWSTSGGGLVTWVIGFDGTGSLGVTQMTLPLSRMIETGTVGGSATLGEGFHYTSFFGQTYAADTTGHFIGRVVGAIMM
jgi:hypothetical protein